MDKSKATMINLKDVKIADLFWSKRIEQMAKEVIPYQWDALTDNIPGAEPSHAVNNFRIAAGLSTDAFHGMIFQDSDVGKWLEAASYSLAAYPNPELEKTMDDLIELIGKAQQPDGYLNTYYTVVAPQARWKNLAGGHELYCAGHLIEGAVAYYETTGKSRLLDIMRRYADYIDEVFGQDEGKLKKYPGHEEIELALVRLYKVTGDAKYLRLSHFFIAERGKHPSFFPDESSSGENGSDKWLSMDYHQAHAPVLEQKKAVGHAVRAMYLYMAMADLVLENGNEPLRKSLDTLWNNVVNSRMYITGGLGSQGHAERFTLDYDLPNDTAYAETCASIGLFFWAYRMLLINTDNQYADIMEKVLYNGIMSGISLDGKKYFYVNPLEVLPEIADYRYDHKHIKTERQLWFGCACCPPNIARLIASLGKYIYSRADDTIFTHLYIGNSTAFTVNSREITLIQENDYLGHGSVKVTVKTDADMDCTLSFRLPGWNKDFSMSINGRTVNNYRIENGYLFLKRTWADNDAVELLFRMNAELTYANPRVRENISKVAIQRGPLIYCIEEVDNGKNLPALFLTAGTQFETEFRPDLLGGITVLKATAGQLDAASWGNTLYRPAASHIKKVKLTAVPYYCWGNRKPGEMLVWIWYK